VIAAVLLAGVVCAQNAEALLRSAIEKETVDGDLKSAIEQYKKVIARAGDNRTLAAKALVRLGLCFERIGDSEARKAYDRVIREFGDQPDSVAQVKSRLIAMERPATGGISLRAVWPKPDVNLGDIAVSPDGRLVTYTDWGNGDLAIRDL